MRLAQVYLDNGKGDLGDELVNQVLDNAKEMLGEDNVQLGHLTHYFVGANLGAERMVEAEALCKRALEIFEKSPESSDRARWIIDAKNDLASVYLGSDREEEANQLFEEIEASLEEHSLVPPRTRSRYVSAFVSSLTLTADPESKGSFKCHFTSSVDPTMHAPEKAFFVFSFENPQEEDEPIIVEHQREGEKSITITSPDLPKAEKKLYRVTLTVYEDESKEKLLGVQHVFCRSRVDTSEIKNAEDLSVKLYELGVASK